MSAKDKLFALMASERAVVHDRVKDIRARMLLIARDEGLIKRDIPEASGGAGAGITKQSKWAVVRARLMTKKDNEIEEENNNSPTKRRKEYLERKANK